MRALPVALALACGSALSCVGGCGYRAVYGGEGQGRVAVVLARSVAADAVAAEEVVSGLREELAREGALAPGDGYPRVEVEVTRIDEASDAIAAGRAPVARGTEVGVVARAWVAPSAGGAPERDTGDVRALVLAAATAATGSGAAVSGAVVDTLRHDDAVRAAARLAGARLARRILGRPAPEVEALGDPKDRGP